MTLRTQVLIIGGGPAGSSAARCLAENGIQALLVERNLSFVKPCGGGLPSTVLKEIRIPEHLERRYIEKVKIVTPHGEDIDIRLREGSIVIVERGLFDRALRDEAGMKGAELLEAEFDCFEDIGKTVTAKLKQRQSCPPLKRPDREDGSPSGAVLVKADYVIAADGVNSRTRHALNIKPSASFVTMSGKIRGELSDTCEFWFGSSHAPRCYSWVFPYGEGISAGTGAFNGAGIKGLWQEFATRRGLDTGGPIRGYRVPLWRGDLYDKGAILFVGDAAGQVMPMTFEGIYYSMKAGELAAQAIIGRRAGDYRRSWESLFRKKFRLMKNLWTYSMTCDRRIERIVGLHKLPQVSEASINFWLKKDTRKHTLLTYLNIFKRLLIS